VLDAAGRVLASRHGADWMLPVVDVQRGMRVAPQIVSALADTYAIDAFCLTDIDGADRASGNGDRAAGPAPGSVVSRTMLADLCGAASANGRWIDADAIRLCDGRTLADVAAQYRRAGRETEQPGFWPRLRQWADEVLANDADGIDASRLTGRRTQWTAGRGFSLVRLDATGAAVWFKAVGAPNEAECGITARLAARHPAHLPHVLAVHDRWCGWLTEELSGHSLRSTGDPDRWTRAAVDLARLQMHERGRAAEWLNAGCVDLRVNTLARQVDDFIHGIEPIFARQERTSLPRLGATELVATADALRRALDTAAILPDTLVHADLNPDNIFFRGPFRSPFRGGSAVFLDWAGTSVGFPFAALENLQGHLRRVQPSPQTTARAVSDAYADAWTDAYGANVVARARAVAPLLRYASLAMRSAGWLRHTATPSIREPLLRSLTRSMWQIVVAPTPAPGQ